MKSANVRRGILAAVVLAVGTSTAQATTIVWEWTGSVTGYTFSSPCAPGSNCGNTIDSIVPVGTAIGVSVSFNLAQPLPNPQTPCYRGTASTSLHVLGRTYTGLGHVWDEAWGFGPGVCVSGYDMIEVVVPGWGNNGPALPEGWIPLFDFDYFPGLWWGGDLTMVQPKQIFSQLPKFYQPGQARPQRFTASLHAPPEDMSTAPEPTTWLLFSTGLAAAAWRRRRH